MSLGSSGRTCGAECPARRRAGKAPPISAPSLRTRLRLRVLSLAGVALAAPWLLSPVACAPERGGVPLAGDISDGLVFVRRDGDGFDLWRARLSDGSVAPLRVTPTVEERWPYWSPGARRLVFQSRPAGHSEGDRLVLLDPTDGAVAPVREPPALHEHWPVWSPDGRKLAYAFNGSTSGGPIQGLALFDVASGRNEVIGPGAEDVQYYRPEFSPDGAWVVAQRAESGNDSKLWLLGAGQQPRRLTNDLGLEQKGRFSKDGDWIVYTRREHLGEPRDLVLIRPDGSDAHVVASTPSADDHTARPSPSRNELAFISTRSGSSDAYLAPFAGGPARRLTRTPHRRESAPRWSPDGEKLALTVLVPGNVYHVVVVDRRGRVLLDVPGQMPDWMPPWP